MKQDQIVISFILADRDPLQYQIGSARALVLTNYRFSSSKYPYERIKGHTYIVNWPVTS